MLSRCDFHMQCHLKIFYKGYRQVTCFQTEESWVIAKEFGILKEKRNKNWQIKCCKTCNYRSIKLDLTHWLTDLFAKNAFFRRFSAWTWAKFSFNRLKKGICDTKACLSFHKHCVLGIQFARHAQKSKFRGFICFLFSLSFFFFIFVSFCWNHWLSTRLPSSSKLSEKAISRRAISTVEKPGVVAINLLRGFHSNF